MRMTPRIPAAPPHRAIAACLIAVAVAVAGCADATGAASAPRLRPATAGPARSPAADPAPSSAAGPARSSAAGPVSSPAASCASRVLAGMTQAQRVGQLFIVGLTGDVLQPAEAAVITSHHFGSVFFVTNTTAGAVGVRSVTTAVQALVSRRATANVRFLVAANQEGGQVQALAGPGFSSIPSALAQGRLSPARLQRSALEWGRQLRAAGVNMDFAPVMDVVPVADVSSNQPIGIYHREYGHTAAAAAVHGDAFIRGMAQAGAATTAKHFPGLGLVTGNTDFTSGVVDDVTTANSPYLGSFQGAIDAGVPFVMVSLARYPRIDPRHLAAFSPVIMRGLLRGRMRFQGVIVSDDLGAAQAVAAIPPATRALRFLAAGGDLITSSTLAPAETMYRAVLRRARADPAFRREVESAAARVIAAKRAAGLLPCGA